MEKEQWFECQECGEISECWRECPTCGHDDLREVDADEH